MKFILDVENILYFDNLKKKFRNFNPKGQKKAKRAIILSHAIILLFSGIPPPQMGLWPKITQKSFPRWASEKCSSDIYPKKSLHSPNFMALSQPAAAVEPAAFFVAVFRRRFLNLN